ncbi:MAG: UPF0149 family protein [Gammaproteobacteria bacterium]
MQLTRLSQDEAKTLGAFLQHEDRPEGTMSFHELQGFLFAVTAAPELIQPSDWLPLISNDEDIGFADEDEAERILDLIMVLYNQINASVVERSDEMPFDCAFLNATDANFDELAPVSQWSCGFIQGHNWLVELWDEWITDEESELSQEIGACLITLSFFSSQAVAEALYLEGSDGQLDDETFDEFAEKIRRLFPSALASYADIGRTISEVLARHGESDE